MTIFDNFCAGPYWLDLVKDLSDTLKIISTFNLQIIGHRRQDYFSSRVSFFIFMLAFMACSYIEVTKLLEECNILATIIK